MSYAPPADMGCIYVKACRILHGMHICGAQVNAEVSSLESGPRDIFGKLSCTTAWLSSLPWWVIKKGMYFYQHTNWRNVAQRQTCSQSRSLWHATQYFKCYVCICYYGQHIKTSMPCLR